MNFDLKIDLKNRKQVIIISMISFFALVYIIFAVVRFNDLSNKSAETEIKLNQTVLDLKKEEKNNKKIGKLTNESIDGLFFQKDIDFITYVRKIFQKNNIKVNIYQSNDNNKDLEVILNFNIQSDDFFKLVRDIEKGDKFISIKSLTVKKDQYPTLKIYMKITGYYL
jgi:hypothetical protein